MFPVNRWDPELASWIATPLTVPQRQPSRTESIASRLLEPNLSARRLKGGGK
jgi:hypothetical protein